MLRRSSILAMVLLLGGCSSLAGLDRIAVEPIIGVKLMAYHAGDWEQWMSHYADDAEIFYNTDKSPMTPQQAAEAMAGFFEVLMRYHFDEDSMIMDSCTDDDGQQWAVFYGMWEGQFESTGRTVRVPTHVRSRIEGVKIVEEHGYWPDGELLEAYTEATQ